MNWESRLWAGEIDAKGWWWPQRIKGHQPLSWAKASSSNRIKEHILGWSCRKALPFLLPDLVWNTAGTIGLPWTPITAWRGYKGGRESTFFWESLNSRFTYQKWGMGELVSHIALEPENLLDLGGALEPWPHRMAWARQWLSSSDSGHAAAWLEPISMEKKSTLLPRTPTLCGRGIALRKWSPWYTPSAQAEYKKSIACTLQNSVLKRTILWYLFFFLTYLTPYDRV